eukprot:m.321336 g.321336  ORF g.321336 m.321336 type:complete len:671 (+) comp25271_c0_seq1:62-2074(+)
MRALRMFVALWALGLCSADPAMDLLKKMNLTEKISMLHGIEGDYVGNVAGNPRLGIPPLRLNDGPQGFRTTHEGTSTCWPSGLTVAATFDRSLLHAWGVALGEEFRGKGANIYLGPVVSVIRVPTGGRNWETIAGEDPYLSGQLSAPLIQGVQSQGVMANAKHYINNNQEQRRFFISATVPERAEREIYLRAFDSAVQAGVFSVMCSYNLINGVYSCENNETFSWLKKDLGFKYFVMSDWLATKSTVAAANAGLDMQMPLGFYFGEALEKAVKAGQVTEATIDNKVYRILTAMFDIGLFNHSSSGNITANVTSAAHNALAHQLAADAIVMLENDNNMLPLPSTGLHIAVLGDAARDSPVVAGHGSGQVTGPYVSTVWGALCERRSKCTNMTYVPTLDYIKAAEVSAKADVAIVVVGTDAEEGFDRASLRLSVFETELIDTVLAVQPNVVVVVAAPGAVLMPWRNRPRSVLLALLGGQEAGNAIADVLLGNVVPSGKLPITIPNVENEMQMTQAQYPGEPQILPTHVNYTEGLAVSYRWYQQHNVDPAYPFGFGLSYTTFVFHNLSIAVQQDQSVLITATIQNTGQRTGKEVAQVYVDFPASAAEPPGQLKGFEKVQLAPGATAPLTFTIPSHDLSVWSVEQHAWQLARGNFTVRLGASSRDHRLVGTFTL